MNKQLILLICLCVLTLSSCKKEKPLRIRYPEDTQDYDATPVERIANKWWVLDSVSVNGVDFTDTVYNTFGKFTFFLSTEELGKNNLKKGTVKFEKKFSIISSGQLQEFSDFYCLWDIGSNFGYFPYGGIGLLIDSAYSYVPYFYHDIGIRGKGNWWSVLKVSDEEVKIKVKFNGNAIINYYKKY